MTTSGNAPRMKPREITCASCGAHYTEEDLRCPYCGSVNDLADEREYMEDLDDVRENMEKLPDEIRAGHTKEALRDVASSMRRAVMVFAAILAVIGLFAGAAWILGAVRDRGSEERREQEYLWNQENLPRLDELYKNEDYDGLLALADELQDGPIYNWDHYDLLDALLTIRRATGEDLESLARAAQEGKDSRLYRDAMMFLLYDELTVKYFDLRCRDEKDVAVIKERGEPCLEDLETRLTQEQTERFDQEIRKAGYVSFQYVEKFVEKEWVPE
ncbi:MAG: hypothetical protein IJG52_08230 [Lachnospiraceae bacterium]|nr:hypothetical protein [Lachnospiraceae bacterium]